MRQVVGERRFTVIFDRGGYDGQLFSWLVEQGLDFITYQRGEVRLAADLFARREVRWEGQRVRFHVAEDTVRVGDSGPWRRIVLRTADGHQTPILTSLAAASVAAARVTALMLARWRQENFFKYARAHLGLDTLASYAADTVADREVPNPAAKTATVELKRLRASAQKARAALGQTMVLDAAQPTGETGPATAKQMKAKRASPASRDALIAQLLPSTTRSSRPKHACGACCHGCCSAVWDRSPRRRDWRRSAWWTRSRWPPTMRSRGSPTAWPNTTSMSTTCTTCCARLRTSLER